MALSTYQGDPLVTGFDQIEFASRTDVGVRRSHNQDAHAILLASDPDQWRKCGHVFMVADGMGAHAVGELASDMAANIIPHTYHKYAEEGAAQALTQAFQEANSSIHSRGQQNPEFHGMGTTGTLLLIREDGAWMGHVGDSRVYRIRDQRIQQLSFDHSLAWELARRKGIKPGGLEGIPTNVIVRSLGPERTVQVDVGGPYPLRAGDVFLLCSDGLSGQLTDQEMGVIAQVLPPAEACQFLVDLANLRGGPDNITVLVIRMGNLPSQPEPGAPESEPPPPNRWSVTWPWPTMALILGLLLAASAVNFTASQLPHFLVFPVIILAALSLLTGVLGLFWLNWKEKKQVPDPEPKIQARIIREAACPLEKPLLDKITKLETTLSTLVRERQLEADWAEHQRHYQQARQALAQNDLVEAFREMCRAILPLSEALSWQRSKGEVFQPLWDKD